jgi:long-chain-fatty-acid--CoA ligase ACSBG
LVYTSGTTGNPKGVMMSHDNLTWSVKKGIETVNPEYLSMDTPGRTVSFLPLSHSGGLVIDIITPLLVGNTVYYCRPDAFQGSLV